MPINVYQTNLLMKRADNDVPRRSRFLMTVYYSFPSKTALKKKKLCNTWI